MATLEYNLLYIPVVMGVFFVIHNSTSIGHIFEDPEKL